MIEDFHTFLQAQAGSRGSAQAHENYTGATHLHYDIAVPVLRDFVKRWTKQSQPTFEQWLALLDGLYTGESVEEKLLGGMLLYVFPKYKAQVPLHKLDEWLGELVGWAEVDGTCQSNFTAKEVLNRWDEWQPFLQKLAADANINKRRASLVLLLRPIRESSETRLMTLAVAQIESLKSEKDKLITKAISWLLRDAIKHHREEVAGYLHANRATLPGFVIREVETKLNTGKKN